MIVTGGKEFVRSDIADVPKFSIKQYTKAVLSDERAM